MRHLLLAAGLLLSPGVSAQELGQSTTAMIYWQRPIGATEKNDLQSSFGFRIDRKAHGPAITKPALDLKFNNAGFHSLALRGAILHQNQPSGEAASAPNPWILGGIIAGSALLVAHEERRARSQRCTPGIVVAAGGGFTAGCIPN